jgi:hypothetical protein
MLQESHDDPQSSMSRRPDGTRSVCAGLASAGGIGLRSWSTAAKHVLPTPHEASHPCQLAASRRPGDDHSPSTRRTGTTGLSLKCHRKSRLIAGMAMLGADTA